MKTPHTHKHTLLIALAGVCLLFAAPAMASASATISSASLSIELPANFSDRVKPHKPKKEKIIKPKRRKRVKYQRTNHGPRVPIFPQAAHKSAFGLWFSQL